MLPDEDDKYVHVAGRRGPGGGRQPGRPARPPAVPGDEPLTDVTSSDGAGDDDDDDEEEQYVVVADDAGSLTVWSARRPPRSASPSRR